MTIWRPVGILLCLASTLACGDASEAPTVEVPAPELYASGSSCRPLEPGTQRNLVLIVGDTIRRDRMGLHGGTARTPAFDALARSGAWFARATTQAPWTKPAIATLFTSMYPSQHKVLSHPALHKDPAARHDVLRSDLLAGAVTTPPGLLGLCI